MNVKFDHAHAILGQHWPYGVDKQNVARVLEWAAQRQLRYSRAHRCLHWIAKGRCAAGCCLDGHSSRQWMDHVSGWTHNGKPAVLICQPYWLRDFSSLVEVQRDWGLDIAVSGNGWYGHGTVLIELTRRSEP